MPVKALHHSFEYVMARLALAIVPRLSRETILRLARVFGRIAYGVSRHLRAVGMANLRIVYGDSKSEAALRSILLESFRDFALVLLDTFWFSRDTKERVAKYVRFGPGADTVLRPKAQVCVTAHMGNWEVLGIAFSFAGYPLTSVAAPLDNEDLNRLFNRLREGSGQRVVSKHGAIRTLLRTLKEGGKVALVLDQNTKPADGGVFVEFFGMPVPVSSAAAALALRTGAEVCVGVCLPTPDGMYETPPPILVETPGPGPSEEERLREFTQRITHAVEQTVRAHPGHWLWTYKRWKYVGPGRRRDEYPFYAKELPVLKPET